MERKESYVSSYRSFFYHRYSLHHSSNACGLSRKILARDKIKRCERAAFISSLTMYISPETDRMRFRLRSLICLLAGKSFSNRPERRERKVSVNICYQNCKMFQIIR